VAGLAVSAYLTAEHYSGSTVLACPENAPLNCAKVTTSAWSRLAGVPVAVLGRACFAAMTLLGRAGGLAAPQPGPSPRGWGDGGHGYGDLPGLG
jgi:uncharacterized membrane protein